MFFLAGILLVLQACQQTEETVNFTETPVLVASVTLTIVPDTATPTASPEPSATQPPPTIAVTPRPSPTPVYYEVVSNDTMIGIAVKFGLTLDELIAANPEVDPQFLSIGIQLVIPVPETEEQEEAAPEADLPEDLILLGPVCLDQVDGNVLCLLQVENGTDRYYENVQVQVSLYKSSGDLVSSKQIYLPLNILLSGSKMPAWVEFEELAGKWQGTSSQVISALPMTYPDEIRYVQTSLELNTEIEEEALMASASGSIQVYSDASIVWLLGAAYDQAGNLVAVRRWEWTNISADIPILFDAWLYSYGPDIDSAEWWTEARPAVPED